MQALSDSPYLRACRGEKTAYTPVWLNRQAGRYMPAYRTRKGKTPALTWFTTPDLMAQTALEARQILGVDAAILFADLLPMMIPLGLRLHYAENIGPVFDNPLRSTEDVNKLTPFAAEEALTYAAEAVRLTRSELAKDIPLIGFTGAPFTLAAYAIEGRGTRQYEMTKKFMYQATDAWHRLMKLLVRTTADYIRLQIDAGVQSVQIFDSWVGCLNLTDFKTYVLPHTQALLQQIAGQVPTIYFGVGNYHLLNLISEMVFDVMALDFRSPLGASWTQYGFKAVQGNLDPALLLADWPTIKTQAKVLLDEVAAKPGHIFNLGHGISPETPVDQVKRLVDFVHEYSARQRDANR